MAGYRKETPSKTQVFNVLEWLRKCCGQSDEGNAYPTTITTTKGTQGMLITIEQYGFYQDPKNYEGNADDNNGNGAGTTMGKRHPDNINKESKESKENKNNYSLEIENFRLRYSKDTLTIIDRYFDILRTTRVSNKIASSVEHKVYEVLNKYPEIVVNYACKTVIDKPHLHSKKENYLFGILRNTSADDAYPINRVSKTEALDRIFEELEENNHG